MSTYMQTYGTKPAQFMPPQGGAFVSSFIGDGFPFRQVESQSGVKLFSCPNWASDALAGSADVDCGLSWLAWPSMNNLPIDMNLTTDGDMDYINKLGGKPYMMRELVFPLPLPSSIRLPPVKLSILTDTSHLQPSHHGSTRISTTRTGSSSPIRSGNLDGIKFSKSTPSS